jgi:hypothetical protein
MTQSTQGYAPAPNPKVSWYHTGLFLGVSLLFCWPVGLLALWTSPKTSLVTKVVATAIFGGLGMLFLIGTIAAGSKHAPSTATAQVTAEVPTAVPVVPPPPAYKNSVALLSNGAYCFLLESDKDLTERASSMQKKSKLTIEKSCPTEGTLGLCLDKQEDKTITTRGYDIAWTESIKRECKGEWHESDAFRNRPLAVTATQLHEAYKENEVQADMQYKGRRLLVSGKVDKVSKDVMDKPFVSLATSNMFMEVLAYDMPENAVASLRKGMSLTLLCTGQGMTLGSPMLHDCSIQQ